MSWLLRHGAAEVGLVLRADGYAPLATVCTLLTTRGGAVSLATLREVVATNAKKRFDVVWDAPPAGFVWPPPADEAAGGAGAVDVAAGADVFREGRIEWIRANQVRGEGGVPLCPARARPTVRPVPSLLPSRPARATRTMSRPCWTTPRC
jgi:hypothetical protein